MSLNIKNERVHDLVRQASERTGMSQTSVVEEAVILLLRRLDDDLDAREKRIDEILADMRSRLTAEDRAALSSDFLYDEDGLPA